MSRLLVVARSSLIAGFHLAGVEAYPADDADEAENLIDQWLQAGETDLVAIDDELLANLDPAFRRKMDSAEQLPYLAIPSGEPRGPEGAHRRRISELIRTAIGFRITFRGEQAKD
jgi:vacuolar-type H+-ATPase subunit F/Vma7